VRTVHGLSELYCFFVLVAVRTVQCLPELQVFCINWSEDSSWFVRVILFFLLIALRTVQCLAELLFFFGIKCNENSSYVNVEMGGLSRW